MCGITGLWYPADGADPSTPLDEGVRRMTDALRHRGPDDSGTWIDRQAGIALGHRRLSIIDLSRQGAQPMQSACGRYLMVYNGEVYNYRQLREELQDLGQRFRGHSDSEVMLAAICEWGLQRALQRFIGMFAIGLWDRSEQRLTLIRDRLGIKPLYWGWIGPAGAGTFAFASELKALCALPELERRIDRQVLPVYLRFGHVPSPQSIYSGIACLEPGTLLELDSAGMRARAPRLSRYWSIREVAAAGATDRLLIAEEEAADRLEQLLEDAVRLRLVSDVPLGAFLSGGIDSSLVVALMQRVSERPVRTFTIGFHEEEYNEAGYAARVAEQLGTDHIELYLSRQEAMAVVPQLPELYDEPFADASQIPTYLVSKLARQHVTVALTGDGGDELFGGYTRYPFIAGDWRRRARLPALVRELLAWGMTTATRPQGRWLLSLLKPLLVLRGRSLHNLDGRLLRHAARLRRQSLDEFYARHGSFALVPESNALLAPDIAGGPPCRVAGPLQQLELETTVEQLMYLDMLQYLPDDILTKVDRASMAVSLETRVPVLDHRLVELAWRLPLSLKLDGEVGKLVLRRVLYRHVPPELVDRPKMGFGIPFGEWICSSLRGWAEELLSPSALGESGLLEPKYINRCWQEHLAGLVDHRNLLWSVLMLQAWRRHWRAS